MSHNLYHGYAFRRSAFPSRLPAFVPDCKNGHMEVIPFLGGLPDFVIIEPRRPIGWRGFFSSTPVGKALQPRTLVIVGRYDDD